MAHSCPDCSEACYCDGEDTWFDSFDDCRHDCDDGYYFGTVEEYEEWEREWHPEW